MGLSYAWIIILLKMFSYYFVLSTFFLIEAKIGATGSMKIFNIFLNIFCVSVSLNSTMKQATSLKALQTTNNSLVQIRSSVYDTNPDNDI